MVQKLDSYQEQKGTWTLFSPFDEAYFECVGGMVQSKMNAGESKADAIKDSQLPAIQILQAVEKAETKGKGQDIDSIQIDKNSGVPYYKGHINK
jgi:hypothetical protein